MLRYVTTNPGKVREAEEYLGDAVSRLDYDYAEIQAEELGPIAARGAREAYRHAEEPVLVDDAGLFIDAFDGFPGPYSSYVENTLGVERVWELSAALDTDTPRAAFRCLLAYCDGDPFDAGPETVDRARSTGAESDSDSAASLPVKLFDGVVRGRIVAPRGEGGFGYDPIFEHDGTTFAEMSSAEKNAVSHRGRALATFAEWYADR